MQKYKDKVAAKRKPKFKPSDKLEAITAVMEKIMKFFNSVEIKTARHPQARTIAGFYAFNNKDSRSLMNSCSRKTIT
jgi:hypothetical protein